MFVPRTNLSRAESVRRLRYLKPATSFRSGFAYDNVLYMVAGQLIEAVTGETWEKFTAEHVLKPAGMQHSTSDEAARFETADRAQPHARMNGGLRGIGDQSRLDERDDLGHNAAPAGGSGKFFGVDFGLGRRVVALADDTDFLDLKHSFGE